MKSVLFDRVKSTLETKNLGRVSLDQRLEDAWHQLRLAVGDQEVKLLLLWGIVSASAALSYLIWIKYPRLRAVAAVMFTMSIVHYSMQYSGVFWAMERFGIIAFLP